VERFGVEEGGEGENRSFKKKTLRFVHISKTVSHRA
jgi:hypothetical protein